MIEKYRSEVLRFYNEKKAAGQLSMNLMNPTSARLRNECRLLFTNGCNKMDQRTLREFLNRPFTEEICELTIKKCDPDKFKSLDNFLKKGINTHEKNVELLARLIDFRPRPYSNYRLLSDGNTGMGMMKGNIVEENTTAIRLQVPHELLPSVPPAIRNGGQNTFVHFLPLLPAFYLGARKMWRWIGKKLLASKSYRNKQYVQKDSYTNVHNVPSNVNLMSIHSREMVHQNELVHNRQNKENEITLEYPSGVKLSVDSSDISLIAQLVRL